VSKTKRIILEDINLLYKMRKLCDESILYSLNCSSENMEWNNGITGGKLIANGMLGTGCN
jgi:hypothetical protein